MFANAKRIRRENYFNTSFLQRKLSEYAELEKEIAILKTDIKGSRWPL